MQGGGGAASCRSHFKSPYWRVKYGYGDREEISRREVERGKEG